MHSSHSAGGVVVNKTGRVLITSQKGDSWSLPKGHIDPGEDTQAAAVREIREESGVTDLTLIKKLGTYQRYKIGKNGKGEDKTNLKTITMFLYTTKQQDLHPTDPNNPEARWVGPSEVVNILTHPKDREFFERALPELKTSNNKV